MIVLETSAFAVPGTTVVTLKRRKLRDVSKGEGHETGKQETTEETHEELLWEPRTQNVVFVLLQVRNTFLTFDFEV